ncbi:PTS fructose transporter subunit IIABC [Brevibacillus dissolubilis]|uniref:PTS fructose transporter subunit IIABC n=1 Tax=Brevibacillus dissolubilis TaxID=1844116 RepID=UPI0011164E4A|nr:PTS fructose transporter subunit IIABC [Brevibacillus dissolubilis]
MRITQLLDEKRMILSLAATNKEEVLDELINALDESGVLGDKAKFKEAILAREAQGSTGIGEGIGIPHGKTDAVKTPAIAFGRSLTGVPFESLDGQNADLFFMIAASANANNEHLETLSQLSQILMDDDVRTQLRAIKTKDEFVQLMEQKQDELFGTDNNEDSDTNAAQAETDSQPAASGKPKVVAVTACPTGIAHTYMAADALKKKATELGIDIKVETNGSGGAKNKLTEQDIAEATCIIVAADRQVDMDRFDGKKLIEVPVADGIHKATELLQRAVKQDAAVYHAGSLKDKVDSAKQAQKSKQPAFYRHLMSGVSNMLPLVVGGGIIIALSFMFGIKASDPNDPSFHPFAKALMDIGGGSAFGLMIPILAGFIAMSIADRPGLAPGLVAGMLASTAGSGFLGGIIAGFLAGYVVEGIKKATSGFPASLEGIKPALIYPLFGTLISGLIMVYIVADPVAALNKGLGSWLSGLGTGNAVLLGIVLGAMMAFDMGGPVNKAAFTFGIAMIAEGNYLPHAAIMAAGMVPPLGLAVATTLFKNKFTPEERDAGKTAYVMGLSFITEGAIPFAAADPARVIPSIVVGSAVAGGLSMAFGCTLPAPHGGLFVLPVVGNWPMYLVAIAAGTIVTALMLNILKKKVA